MIARRRVERIRAKREREASIVIEVQRRTDEWSQSRDRELSSQNLLKKSIISDKEIESKRSEFEQ